MHLPAALPKGPELCTRLHSLLVLARRNCTLQGGANIAKNRVWPDEVSKVEV